MREEALFCCFNKMRPFCVLYFYYITGFVITFVAFNNYICLNIKKLNLIAVFS